jgi:predicted HicB family RNase H-like nuclease
LKVGGILAQAKTGKKARDPDAFKGIMTRMNADGWRALRILAAEQDTTLNALAIEAFNDLLKKYGKKPAVQNPLVD